MREDKMQMWSPSHKKMIPVGPPGQVCLSAEKEMNSATKKSSSSASSTTQSLDVWGIDCKNSLWFNGSDDVTVTVVDGNECVESGNINAGYDSSIEKNGKHWQSKKSMQQPEATDANGTETKSTHSPYFIPQSVAAISLLSKSHFPRTVQNGTATRSDIGSNDSHEPSTTRKEDSPVLVQLHSGDEIVKWIQDWNAKLGKDLSKEENIPEITIKISFPGFEKTEDDSLPIIQPLLEEGEDEKDNDYNNPYIPSAPKYSIKQELELLNDMKNPRPSTSKALRREMGRIKKAAARRERLSKKGLGLSNDGASRVFHGATTAAIVPQEVNENMSYLSPTRRSSRVRDPHPARSLVRQNLFPEGSGNVPRKRKELEPEDKSQVPQSPVDASPLSTKGSTLGDIGTEETSPDELVEVATAVRTPSPIKRHRIGLNQRGVQVKKLKLTDKRCTEGEESPLPCLNNSQPRTSRRIITRGSNAKHSQASVTVKEEKVEVIDLSDDCNISNPKPNPKEEKNLSELPPPQLSITIKAISPKKIPVVNLEQVKVDRTDPPEKMTKPEEQQQETGIQQLTSVNHSQVPQVCPNDEVPKYQKSQKINGEESAPLTPQLSARTLRARPRRNLPTPPTPGVVSQKQEAAAEVQAEEEGEKREESKVTKNGSVNILTEMTTILAQNSTDTADVKKENGDQSSNDGINIIDELVTRRRETRQSNRKNENKVNEDNQERKRLNVLPEVEIGRSVKQSPESHIPVDSPLLEIATSRRPESAELMDASKHDSGRAKQGDKSKGDPLNPVVTLQRLSQSPETGTPAAIIGKQSELPKSEFKFRSASVPLSSVADRPKSKSTPSLQIHFEGNGRSSRSSKQLVSIGAADVGGRVVSPPSRSAHLSEIEVQQSVCPKSKRKINPSKSCPNELRISLQKLDPAELKKKFPNLEKHKNNNEKKFGQPARSVSESSGSTDTSLASTPDQSTNGRRSGRAKKPAKRMDNDQWVW